VEGDRILRSTGEGSLKARNAKRDPRVSRRPDRDFTIMDRISREYTGAEFPMRGNPAQRVVLVIEVDRARYHVLPFRHTPAKR
jgi:hypothetical protein